MFKFWGSRQDRWRNWTLRYLRPGGICAEIGVWKGDFSAQILRAEESVTLHLIDPWIFDPNFPERWYGGALARKQTDMDRIYESVVRRFRPHSNVMVQRLRSLDAAPLFGDMSLDWVYIDGDHSEAAVEADILAWLPKIKPGGALVGDDYDWLDADGARSVEKAVKSACGSLKIFTERIEAGQYLIRVPT